MTDGERDIVNEIEADARDIAESTPWVCVFCGEARREDDALEAGWVDDFWTEQDIEEEPIDGEPCRAACVPCAAEHLDDIEDDPCLKTGHEIYFTRPTGR